MSAMQVRPSEKDMWEAEREDDVQSSGYGVFLSSIPTTSASSTATSSAAVTGGDTEGTATPETDTGTDFGLLGSYTKGISKILALGFFSSCSFNSIPLWSEMIYYLTVMLNESIGTTVSVA